METENLKLENWPKYNTIEELIFKKMGTIVLNITEVTFLKTFLRFFLQGNHFTDKFIVQKWCKMTQNHG